MAKNPGKTQIEIDSELLTAYLDGELADADCIAVEKRLAEDQSFHSHMRELQSAWDLLESLPFVQPNSHFVQTTVEMAIAGKSVTKPNSGIILKCLLLALVPAAIFGISYFAKRESIEQPERELVNDLPLIENHDRYTQVVFKDSDEKKGSEKGIQFLKSIYARGLFREVDDLFSDDSREVPSTNFDSTSQPPDANRIRDRSDRLSRMTDQQREELFEKKKKFEALDAKQQETRREFHDLLAAEPDRTKLVEVINSYYDWLKILGMNQRATLQDLPLDERLREIGKITRQQAQESFGASGSTKLPLDDAVLFYQWYDFSIRYYEPEIRERTGEVLTKLREAKGLPANEMAVDRIKAAPIEELVGYLMRNDREPFGKILCDNIAEKNIGIDYLREITSPEARSIIDQPGFSDADRRELILKWIETANQARFPIKQAALQAFYAELTEEQRDQLDNLHPNQWHETITRMYWEKNIGQRSTPSEVEAFQKFLQQSGWGIEFGASENDS